MTNLARKWSSAISLQPYVAHSGWMTTHRCRCRPNEANSVSLFLQIWQLRMPTLNQQLGSFPAKSRAENFFLVKKRLPSSTPINRSRFHGLMEETIRSKVGLKPAPLPPFLQFFLSLSPPAVPATNQSHHQLHHRKPTQPPTDHQAATAALSLLLPAVLSPLQLFLLPPIANSSHHHLSRRFLSHRPNHLITSETPTLGNFLLPASPLSSSSWLLHA